MGFVWITEKERREMERQQQGVGNAIAAYVRAVILTREAHHE